MSNATGRIKLLLCLFALAPTSAALAQYRALAPAIPPIVMSQDGITATSGIAVDIAREAAARAGITITVDIQPWPRAYDTAMRSRNVFLMPVVRNAEREALFEWIGPINRHDFKLYRLKSGSAPPVTTIEQIGTRPVGVLNGIFVHEHLKDAKLPNLHTPSSFHNLVTMFTLGRVEYIVATRASLSAELTLAGTTLNAVEELFGFNIETSDAHSFIVMAKGSDPDVVQKMRQALQSMQKDGTWNKLFQKYQP